MATEALRRFGELHAIEARVRGQSSAHRLAGDGPSRYRSCKLCMPGWECCFAPCPATARLPTQFVTRSRAGRV
jgi:hypothetical protein